ncbi:unnamed protein product, partial [Iphiclides podalirius]
MHPLDEYAMNANINLDEWRRQNEAAHLPMRTIFRCAYLAAIIVFAFYILASLYVPMADEEDVIWGIIVEAPNAGNIYGECTKDGGYCYAQPKKVALVALGRLNPEVLRHTPVNDVNSVPEYIAYYPKIFRGRAGERAAAD